MNPPNLSSLLFGNSEGEQLCFSSTSLYDSLDHEDFDVHLEFSDRGCHDLFAHSLDCNYDSLVVDLSMQPIFDDLLANEVETPQDVKALQPEMVVMSGPRCLKVSSSLNHKYVEPSQAPHHSLMHIEINIIHTSYTLRHNLKILSLTHWRSHM